MCGRILKAAIQGTWCVVARGHEEATSGEPGGRHVASPNNLRSIGRNLVGLRSRKTPLQPAVKKLQICGRGKFGPPRTRPTDLKETQGSAFPTLLHSLP